MREAPREGDAWVGPAADVDEILNSALNIPYNVVLWATSKASRMPIEIRHMIFSAGEVVDAAALFSQQRGKPMPSGTVTAAAPMDTADGDAIGFRILLELDRPEGRDRDIRSRTFDYVGSDLAAVLILYCKRRNIPLPMKGAKSLQRFGSKIGLVVSMNNTGEEVPDPTKP